MFSVLSDLIRDFSEDFEPFASLDRAGTVGVLFNSDFASERLDVLSNFLLLSHIFDSFTVEDSFDSELTTVSEILSFKHSSAIGSLFVSMFSFSEVCKVSSSSALCTSSQLLLLVITTIGPRGISFLRRDSSFDSSSNSFSNLRRIEKKLGF